MFKKITGNCRYHIATLILGALMAMPAGAALINLSATLDCAQASAGAGTCAGGGTGSGVGMMEYNDITDMLSWEVSWSGMSGAVSAAHFHGPATPDMNAGVQINIFEVNPAIGMAQLTTAQADDMLAGLWYINIHSSTFGGGEIRGQVNVVPLPAAAWLFGTALLGLGAIKRRKS